MSEPALRGQTSADAPSGEPLDPVSLAALLASRLCHDLVNPVSALGSGLEILEDEAMRDDAADLIRNGGGRAVALLKFARLAYGASGGRGAELLVEEAGEAVGELMQWAKADLDWRLKPGGAPKEIVKILMILTQYASECAPRGGAVRVDARPDGYEIAIEGERIILAEGLAPALAGESADLIAKFAPAYLAGMMARERGGAVAVARERADRVVFTAEFPS